MKSIKTIPELIAKLSEEPVSNYTEVLSALDLSLDYFDANCSWSDEKYTRTCLYNDDHFELILLCWEVGNKTPIHCHGGEECWVRVIKGELEEVFYENTNNSFNQMPIKKQNLAANGLSYISDFIGLHSLENVSSERSISLHLYAEPIKECRYFNVEKQSMIYSTMRYDKDISSSF